MESAKQFQEYAEECISWAKSAETDQERETFLQMARTWMEAEMLVTERQQPRKARGTNAADDATA
jgi:hypothetical protein